MLTFRIPSIWCLCTQVYKLNQDTALKGLQAGSDEARATLDRLVTSTVALKVAM